MKLMEKKIAQKIIITQHKMVRQDRIILLIMEVSLQIAKTGEEQQSNHDTTNSRSTGESGIPFNLGRVGF